MSKPKTLSIIAFSSDFGKIHYALATAAAAVATNMNVTIMFTMGAIRAVTVDSSGVPGWGYSLTQRQRLRALVRMK